MKESGKPELTLTNVKEQKKIETEQMDHELNGASKERHYGNYGHESKSKFNNIIIIISINQDCKTCVPQRCVAGVMVNTRSKIKSAK